MEETKNKEKIINNTKKAKEEKNRSIDEISTKLQNVQKAKIEALKYEEYLKIEKDRYISYPEYDGAEAMYDDIYWSKEKHKEAILELETRTREIIKGYSLINDVELLNLEKLYWEEMHDLDNEEITKLSIKITNAICMKEDIIDIVVCTQTLERVIFEKTYSQIWEYINNIKMQINSNEYLTEKKQYEIVTKIEEVEEDFFRKMWGLRMLLNNNECIIQ